MTVDAIIEDSRWQDVGLEPLSETAIRTALGHLGLDPDGFEVAVLGCDDARITVLNGEFREKPTATNVLSWPEEDRASEIPGATPVQPEANIDDPTYLGDLAIAFDTCQREALEQDKPFSAHVTHLILHGLLHLLGYDHIRDPDATLMERVEIEILGKMGLPDPYRI